MIEMLGWMFGFFRSWYVWVVLCVSYSFCFIPKRACLVLMNSDCWVLTLYPYSFSNILVALDVEELKSNSDLLLYLW